MVIQEVNEILETGSGDINIEEIDLTEEMGERAGDTGNSNNTDNRGDGEIEEISTDTTRTANTNAYTNQPSQQYKQQTYQQQQYTYNQNYNQQYTEPGMTMEQAQNLMEDIYQEDMNNYDNYNYYNQSQQYNNQYNQYNYNQQYNQSYNNQTYNQYGQASYVDYMMNTMGEINRNSYSDTFYAYDPNLDQEPNQDNTKHESGLETLRSEYNEEFVIYELESVKSDTPLEDFGITLEDDEYITTTESRKKIKDNRFTTKGHFGLKQELTEEERKQIPEQERGELQGQQTREQKEESTATTQVTRLQEEQELLERKKAEKEKKETQPNITKKPIPNLDDKAPQTKKEKVGAIRYIANNFHSRLPNYAVNKDTGKVYNVQDVDIFEIEKIRQLEVTSTATDKTIIKIIKTEHYSDEMFAKDLHNLINKLGVFINKDRKNVGTFGLIITFNTYRLRLTFSLKEKNICKDVEDSIKDIIKDPLA